LTIFEKGIYNSVQLAEGDLALADYILANQAAGVPFREHLARWLVMHASAAVQSMAEIQAAKDRGQSTGSNKALDETLEELAKEIFGEQS
jgi:hypothetical protein